MLADFLAFIANKNSSPKDKVASLEDKFNKSFVVFENVARRMVKDLNELLESIFVVEMGRREFAKLRLPKLPTKPEAPTKDSDDKSDDDNSHQEALKQYKRDKYKVLLVRNNILYRVVLENVFGDMGTSVILFEDIVDDDDTFTVIITLRERLTVISSSYKTYTSGSE